MLVQNIRIFVFCGHHVCITRYDCMWVYLCRSSKTPDSLLGCILWKKRSSVCVCVCVRALVHACLCMPCLITPLLFSRQHQLCQVASSWRNLTILVWKSKNWNPMIGSFAWICSTQIPPALLNPRMHLPPAALLLWVLELVVQVSAWCSSVKVLFSLNFLFALIF